MLDAVLPQSVSPVFVGRGTELTALTDALARAERDGEPQPVVIGGEAGLGKSRLLEEFAVRATAAGATVAVGGCVELGSDGLPFAPFAAILRSLHRRFPDALTAAAAGRETELARLLPGLGESLPQPAREAAGDRARLFEFTARLLERLAADRTLLIAVEDLHWADRSTRELLGYLFRAVQDARLVLVATYRTDDIHRRHPLRPFLAELDRLRSVRRIELRRFTQAEVTAQMTGITGTEPGTDLARTVFTRSEGNPFFVEELTAHCGGGLRGMSESLRDLLLVRVEALPEETQEVLRIVAEGGSTLEHGLLAAVARRPEPELLAALRDAVGAQVLVPTEDGDGYRFRHALMREAVTDDLLPGERARLNRRYAEALEAAPQLVRADQRAARLAGYWYYAGEPAKALPAVLDAAVQARRRYAFAEQLHLLQRALELWDAAPPGTLAALRPVDVLWAYPESGPPRPADQVDILAEATLAGVLADQSDRAQLMVRQALKLLDERADPLRAAWFWMQRSRLKVDGVSRRDGLAELGRAKELLRGLPPTTVHAQVFALAAAQMQEESRGPETFEAARRAVDLARAVGTESTELYARLTLAALRADSGRVEEGTAEMRAVLDRVLERGYVSLLGRSMVNLTATLGGVGRLAEAERTARQSEELAGRHGLDEALPWLATNRAWILFMLGRWQEAEAALEAVVHGHPVLRLRSSGLLLAGIQATLRGDAARGTELLADAVAPLPGRDLLPDFALIHTRLRIELALADGDIGRVREAFLEALPLPAVPFTTTLFWELLTAVAGAEAELRGLPAAADGRAEALAGIRDVVNGVSAAQPLWAAFGRLVDAALRTAEGRGRPADWAAAADALEPLSVPYYLALARTGLAESLLAAGDRAAAAGPLRLSREAAGELGAGPLLDRSRRLAARGGLLPEREPAPRAAADGPGAPAAARDAAPAPFRLTPRERDVLALVAAGRSNRQIAEELFISPKTASVHVSNIMAKLEVSSRGEAAAVAHRLRLTGTP
ncbi:helix-turn-helix transcriptional regulator [Streptomyces aidingensis]|uniref:Regulatory protein, luxR family n=1 Tax=Streptomyces aidingensis TaxID=910347 RepID=A0A1I1NY70_9ACTN|nr:helix-turn-helix transcriptional regulator [Streptomyces aidingensis]SFC98660.1 regulatory protein, luxR family [Streptomyces aidingensis]